MPMVDALARVQEIRATIISMSPATTTPGAAAAFSSVLASTGAASVSAPASGTMSTNGTTGQDIVEAAKKYIGVPYVFGGEDASGMDCSGLVQKVLADLGIDAPRVVSQQQHIGTEVKSLADAKPGDLLVTHNADHVVIYAGNGQIIHAPYAGRTVSLQKNYLTDADIQTIRRVVPTEAAPTTQVNQAALTDLIAAARASMITGGVS